MVRRYETVYNLIVSKKTFPKVDWLTDDNLADLLIQGINTELISSSLWEYGLSWLVNEPQWLTWNQLCVIVCICMHVSVFSVCCIVCVHV